MITATITIPLSDKDYEQENSGDIFVYPNIYNHDEYSISHPQNKPENLNLIIDSFDNHTPIHNTDEQTETKTPSQDQEERKSGTTNVEFNLNFNPSNLFYVTINKIYKIVVAKVASISFLSSEVCKQSPKYKIWKIKDSTIRTF